MTTGKTREGSASHAASRSTRKDQLPRSWINVYVTLFDRRWPPVTGSKDESTMNPGGITATWLPRRSVNRTDPDAASQVGVAPSVRSGNSHVVGADADRRMIDSFSPNVVADSSRSESLRSPRYTAASPCAATGTF